MRKAKGQGFSRTEIIDMKMRKRKWLTQIYKAIYTAISNVMSMLSVHSTPKKKKKRCLMYHPKAQKGIHQRLALSNI